MKPEYLADPEGRGACGVKGHDRGSASAAPADWDGRTSPCALCVPLSCSALPCPCAAAGLPHGCPLSPALPPSSAVSVLIPCPGPAAEVWDAERDPSIQEPQPGHDGALPQITGLPHPSPCLIPCSLQCCCPHAACCPHPCPAPLPHLLSPPCLPPCPCLGRQCEPSCWATFAPGSCFTCAAPSLTSAWAGLPTGLQAGWHTLSVSAASQLPSLPAGRAGQSTASTLSCSWLLPPSLVLLWPGEARDSVLASGMSRSSPPALTARWC